MQKLSVVISAYNEEKKLADCLASVSFADEIIVIDNESSDKTAEIAKKAKATVYTKPNNLMLNVNKNYGFTKAKGDWILNLDADERVTDDLKREITEKLSGEIGEGIAGFAIPRKNIIFGKWIQHTGWYPDHQLRLFRRQKGRFSERHVHEQLQVDGNIEKLLSPMLHESYQTVREFLVKLFTIYAPNEAEELMKSEVCKEVDGKKICRPFAFSWKNALESAVTEFNNRFFTKKGYRDGVHGLMLSVLMGFYYFVVHTYVWEKEKFVDNDSDTLDGVSEEINKLHKEGYWQLTAKMDTSKNPLTIFYYKVKRKLLLL